MNNNDALVLSMSDTQSTSSNKEGLSSQSESIKSLKTRFWESYTSLQKDEEAEKISSEIKSNNQHYALLDKGQDRPSDKELVEFTNTYLPNSSSSYGGSLPLASTGQNYNVLVRSSNCWRSTGYVVQATNPSFHAVDKILTNKYAVKNKR